MVKDAAMITEEVAEEVAEAAGEVSLSAVREVVGASRLESVEKAVMAGEADSLVLIAGLEGVEEEMVQEAAKEAGEEPSKWLTERVVYGEKAAMGYTSLEQQIEDAIFRHS